jgi:phage terminase large subunit-like protein
MQNRSKSRPVKKKSGRTDRPTDPRTARGPDASSGSGTEQDRKQTEGCTSSPVPKPKNQRIKPVTSKSGSGSKRKPTGRTESDPETVTGLTTDLLTIGQQKAQQVKRFFERCLTHQQGNLAGHSFALSEWQFTDIIQPLFGTIRADGLRQYRTSYIEIPRKNGKSTLCAGIALYLLLADPEQGAEIVSAAADREQASIVFDLASRMVQSNKLLSEQCHVLRKEIITKSGNRYRALSADAYTKHGMNCSAIIFDELHAQPNRELWSVLTTSVAARLQPLTVAITTAGHDRTSLCYEMHSYAKSVLDGSIQDPTFLPILYAAGETDDWKVESTWKKANPGYGISVRPEYLAQAAAEAATSPAKELAFRRLHLCQWTDTVTRWLSFDLWDQCQCPRPDLDGRTCYGALDLSSTQDLSAFVLVFPLDDGTLWIEPFCWAPRGVLKQRERSNRMRYDQWVGSGHLNVTDGDVIEYEEVYAQIKRLATQYRIQDIAIDRWNCAQLAQQMQSDGLQVVAFGQGYASMSPAAKDFETLLASKKIRHSGHPVLRWCLGNCSIESDAAGNIKPSKSKSSEKIDALIASIMAVARSRVGEAGGRIGHNAPSVYESRGMMTL